MLLISTNILESLKLDDGQNGETIMKRDSFNLGKFPKFSYIFRGSDSCVSESDKSKNLW